MNRICEEVQYLDVFAPQAVATATDKASAFVDTHRMMATITTALPPLSLAMPSANTPRQPVRSSPATTTNSPVKNSSVL